MKTYYAGGSDHGSSSSHGFCNDWTVWAFDSKQARDKFVEESSNLSMIAIPAKDVTKHASNYSLTDNCSSGPQPFSRDFWAIVTSFDWDWPGEKRPEGCIGFVDVYSPDCEGQYSNLVRKLYK